MCGRGSPSGARESAAQPLPPRRRRPFTQRYNARRVPELELYMRVGQPLEPVLADLDRTLDAWQSGGVKGLVIGRLVFEGSHLAYTPNPTIYRKWEVPSPDEPAETFPD